MANKKERKKKPTRKLHVLYTSGGGSIERKNKNCPKCGPGMFMANHKDRIVCGKCRYVEMKAREKKEENKEDKTEE